MGKADVRRRTRMDDADLGGFVVRAQAGDETAFTRVYREVQPMLLGYLRGLVADDAEDVAAETWLQITRDLGTFRGDGQGFRGWAATIARHRALDHRRRQGTRPETTPLDQAPPGLHRARDAAVEALEHLDTVRALRVVAALPRDQAEAVLLRVVLGLDASRAAQVLGKRAGAVRTAAHRGLRRLAAQLALAQSASEDGNPDRRQSGGG